jgi:hypothetical protein
LSFTGSEACVERLILNQSERLRKDQSELNPNRPGHPGLILYSPLQGAVVASRSILNENLLLADDHGEELSVLRHGLLLLEKVFEGG